MCKFFRSGCVFLLCLGFAAASVNASNFEQVDVGGGQVSMPATYGDYLYLGTGATITTWNLADPTAPVLIRRGSDAPTKGMINDIASVGSYLYAGWTIPALGTGGLTVYSLINPAHPVAIAEIDNVFAASLAAAGNYVYVGDSYNGQIVAIDVSDPLKPVVGVAINGFDAANDAHMAVFGTRLIGSGTTFSDDRAVDVFDLTDPANPVAVGSATLDGFTVLRSVLSENYAVGVGFDLQVYDLTDPSSITRIFDTSIDEAVGAMLRGTTAYVIGTTGIQVWDFTSPSAPSLLRTIALDVFAPDQVADTPFGPLLLTHTDRGLLLDATDAGNPSIAAEFVLPIGVMVHNAAFDAGHIYFAEEAYGFSVADPLTLAPLGRFDVDLPEDIPQRDVEDIAVDGGRAYLAVWGYGVIIADLTDPTQATTLGRFEFPYASAIEAHGDTVYVGSTTDGGIMRVLDVSNPASPQQLGSVAAGQIYAMTARGDTVFLAEDGGLQIVDVSNPALPVITGQFTDCGPAGGLSVSSDAGTTYLACTGDGTLRILDTTDKTAPAQIGSVTMPDNPLMPGYAVAYDVVVDGTMAYVGNAWGVDEVDVSNPAAPVAVMRHDTAYDVRKVAMAPDGRLYGFAGPGGVYVYAQAVADRIFANGFE